MDWFSRYVPMIYPSETCTLLIFWLYAYFISLFHYLSYAYAVWHRIWFWNLVSKMVPNDHCLLHMLVQFHPAGWVAGLVCMVNSIQLKLNYATFKTRAFVMSMFFTHNLPHCAAIQRGSHGEEQKSLANSHQESKLGYSSANSLVSELGNFFSIFNRSNNLITNLWKTLNLYCKWSSP